MQFHALNFMRVAMLSDSKFKSGIHGRWCVSSGRTVSRLDRRGARNSIEAQTMTSDSETQTMTMSQAVTGNTGLGDDLTTEAYSAETGANIQMLVRCFYLFNTI